MVERRGEGEFSVRRVRGSASGEPVEMPAPAHGDPPAASAALRPPAIAARVEGSASRRRPPPRLAARRRRPLPFAASPAERQLPPINLLQLESVDRSESTRTTWSGSARRSARAAREFGVEGTVEGINPGPVITVFEFQPAPGVKVSQIVNLQDDLALALKAESVRIDRIPGRSTLGIEVPNKKRAHHPPRHAARARDVPAARRRR